MYPGIRHQLSYSRHFQSEGSELSGLIIWKLMRVMWVRMSEEMGDDQMPEDWVDATLVCLYKGKGSRQDPGMYRGISLISSMEKIFTTVILNRINIWVDKVISQQACGFRANKSCRDAVFSLWRCWRGNGEQRKVSSSL